MRYSVDYNKAKVRESDFEKIISIPNNLNSKQDLLDFFNKELTFPDYFGYNWDALFDCLSDLYWLDYKEIIIYHDSLPKLNKNDLSIYFGIIKDLLKRSDRNGKFLKFIFNIQDRDEINSLLL